MLKRFISIFLIFIIIITSISTPTLANRHNGSSDFKEWDETHLVGSFKEWTIEFNGQIEESVDNNNVYIENHRGEIQDTEVSLGNDGRTIIVEPPRGGYSEEYDYTLYIKNINSISGRVLKENIQMKFFVDNGDFREDIEYQEEVVELEDISIDYDYGYYEEIIMSIEEFESQNLQEGSIILINPTAEDIYGYAGKIASYREDGQNVVIETEEPNLDEIFTYIDIKGEQDISVEQMMDVQLMRGMEARKYREYRQESNRYVDGVEYIFGSGGSNIADVGVGYGDFIIKGSIRVENPVINFDIKTSFFKGLERFHLTYSADIISDLEIEYKDSFSGGLDQNITLFKYPIPLGPTGLIADFELDVYAEGNINASGKIEARISQTTQIILGARKSKSGDIEWVRNTTKEVPQITSLVETEFRADAEVGISPSIELSFFKIISTELEGKIGPYVKLDAKLNAGGNLSEGYFNGRLYTEVGVAFSSTVYLGDAFGIIDKANSLGRTEIKIWSYIQEHSADSQGKLQYIKFPTETINMKVNESKKLDIIGVYRNNITGKEFESQIKDGLEFKVLPYGSATVDKVGNVRILNDKNKEIEIVVTCRDKQSSLVIYVEDSQGGGNRDIDNYKNMISAGAFHTVALKKDGKVWAWGNNYFGSLGNGTNKDSHTPIQVKGLDDVVSIFDKNRFGEYSLALKKDGTVWTWGVNYWGEDIAIEESNIPIQVEKLNNVNAIATGLRYLIVLKEDGTVWGLGSNLYGQLGIDTDWPLYYDSAVLIQGLNKVKSIDANGNSTSLAVKEDGSVWGWGENYSGLLGDEERNGASNSYGLTIPVQIKGLDDVVDISAGISTIAALKGDGTVWSWGSNVWGALGDGTYNDSNIPVRAKGLEDVVAISMGGNYVTALKKDGTVWTWGINAFGTLGDGSYKDSNIPVKVKGLSEVVAISSGDRHVVALKKDGTLWSWGYNGEGQLGDGSVKSSNVPVQVLIKLW